MESLLESASICSALRAYYVLNNNPLELDPSTASGVDKGLPTQDLLTSAPMEMGPSNALFSDEPLPTQSLQPPPSLLRSPRRPFDLGPSTSTWRITLEVNFHNAYGAPTLLLCTTLRGAGATLLAAPLLARFPSATSASTAIFRNEFVPAPGENIIVVAALLKMGHAGVPAGVSAVEHVFGLDTEAKRATFLDRYALPTTSVRLACEALIPPTLHNGVVFEAHTQNSLLRFDSTTGALRGFVTMNAPLGTDFKFLPGHCVYRARVRGVLLFAPYPSNTPPPSFLSLLAVILAVILTRRHCARPALHAFRSHRLEACLLGTYYEKRSFTSHVTRRLVFLLAITAAHSLPRLRRRRSTSRAPPVSVHQRSIAR
ncbi:hypothetical protein C8R46DRAFT_1212395 [Mycena filopes]|nr:hypothetical protein C8R46DRAFT_1212395 [Mycena filopes]